jgi:hyaluronoglucosaminidase
MKDSEKGASMTPELGIIEGYFGRAWTWADRTAVMRRLAAAGYRFFHYAPKIDSHLRRNWQTRHAPAEHAALAAFASACREARVRFGVGLTPYGAHLDFSTDTRAALKAKLAMLDSLGVQDLAILFDDMRGDIADLADRQADIMALCLDHSEATRFFMCPSYYSDDPVLDRVFGERPKDYLATLGKRIDPAVHIYWTGEEVCAAQITPGSLQHVTEQLRRKPTLWDNYPVNDGPRMSQYLHLRSFTGRPHVLHDAIAQHAINPASQPTLSCIPALTLPMSYQLGARYCYGAAFLQAATAVVGEVLARQLQADLLTLQQTGLDRLGDRKATLIERYAAFDHPAAREVIDWLGDGYAITGEMLQTQ